MEFFLEKTKYYENYHKINENTLNHYLNLENTLKNNIFFINDLIENGINDKYLEIYIMCIVYEYGFKQFKNNLELLTDFIFEKIINMKFYKIHNREIVNFTINDVLRYFSRELIDENIEIVIKLLNEYQYKKIINFGDNWNIKNFKYIIENYTLFFSKKLNVFILNGWIDYNLDDDLLNIRTIHSLDHFLEKKICLYFVLLNRNMNNFTKTILSNFYKIKHDFIFNQYRSCEEFIKNSLYFSIHYGQYNEIMMILDYVKNNTFINNLYSNNINNSSHKIKFFWDLFGDRNPYILENNIKKLQCDDNYIFSIKNECIFIEKYKEKNISLNGFHIDFLMDINYYNLVFQNADNHNISLFNTQFDFFEIIFTELISNKNIKIIHEKYSIKILDYIKQNDTKNDIINRLKTNENIKNSNIKRFIKFSYKYDSEFTINDIMTIFLYLLKYKGVWYLSDVFSYIIDMLHKNNIDILKYGDDILQIEYLLRPIVFKKLIKYKFNVRKNNDAFFYNQINIMNNTDFSCIFYNFWVNCYAKHFCEDIKFFEKCNQCVNFEIKNLFLKFHQKY